MSRFQFLVRCRGINSLCPEEVAIRNALVEWGGLAAREARNEYRNQEARTRYLFDDKHRECHKLRTKGLHRQTRKFWLWMLAKLDYRCSICGEQFSPAKLHVDHIIPVSRGGKTEWSNIQPLCEMCNIRKSNKYIPPSRAISIAQEEWVKLQKL